MAPPTLLVALSGPSSSGKTTLARLLRDALSPRLFILHEDDFYKTDADIPVVTVADGRKLQDWDCLESVDVDALEDMLNYIKEHGQVRDEFQSKEDTNAVGEVDMDKAVIQRWRMIFEHLLNKGAGSTIRIGIVDGFLLYSEDVKSIREKFDIKLLLKADYATVKARRERRKGYVTLEGFWEDPGGYVDLVVWPNYVKDHSFLFEQGDVNGEVNKAVLDRLGIAAMPRDAVEDMTTCFEWACNLLSEKIEEHLKNV
ncbi:P-loop containing nucleoside triphosphate hydrolase protein [Tothia fuscella]|uniref:P-loop containing nucleoside triphosphate hydrolase protein n=1 Tax=Tothia fuscella TaxID=1048955 RepID=A0A9P4U0T6_9PEZI|nr:P-loop containing nucleoside triphosphate hydrolase protein [Tothia fuscella]